MIAIEALIVFVATLIGAITGLGGGVIIKPFFELAGLHDTQTIGVLSAFAVFTMSIVSLVKNKQHFISLQKNIILFLASGSFLGGLLGNTIFGWIKTMTPDENLLKLSQSMVLLLVLIIIVLATIFKSRIKTYRVKSAWVIFSAGLLLGCISVFLGIGGGPLNIICLSVLFSFGMKESVIYSISTVFFAQLSKLTQVYIVNQFKEYDLGLIVWICLFALLGGYVGSKVHLKISSAHIQKIYLLTMIFLIFLTLFNISRCFI